MRYHLRGVEIRSENAAKPIESGNRFLLRIISKLPNHFRALDYGCGKLRYAIPLCSRVKHVVAVDSKHQISRVQTLKGERTSVKKFAHRHINLTISHTDQSFWKKRKYDFILCANVLSAIPIRKRRLDVLKKLAALLKEGGQILVVSQYRNGYFSSFKKRSDAQFVNDGWLLKRKTTGNFFAILSPKMLCEMAMKSHLSILRSEIANDAAYVWLWNG